MCYMSETERRPARVGVRELRQNLSVYLDRVKAGETLEVTEHGMLVAELRPRPPKPTSILDQLIAEGKVTPATHDHRLTPMPPPPPPGYSGPTLSEIIQQMRDEDER
jgi:prevent-host-death family protein